MILADKIIQLRKQRDWSQEELAQKIGVSRQTVSAWETSQSSPEISHIIALSNLLGVSTDSVSYTHLTLPTSDLV